MGKSIGECLCCICHKLDVLQQSVDGINIDFTEINEKLDEINDKLDCSCEHDEWAVEKEYKVGDIVLKDGKLYKCIKNNHSTNENAPPETTHWKLV